MPGFFSTYAARSLRSLLERRMRVLTDDELAESTVVIAPHQDDETLGCGGTIARKRQLGTRVRIIYTTDGSRSHDGRIERSALAGLRKDEALAACQVLGVPKRDVSFLGIENGALEEPDQKQRATEQLIELLAADPPRQMLIPFHREPPPDHFVSTAIALDAIERLQLHVSVWEYPIWFWHCWPFSWDPVHTLRDRARRLKQSWRRLGPMLRELRTGVDVGSVLDLKRKALEQHATQTARRGNDPDWPILDDVCDGAFTALFFQRYELLYERVRAPLPAREVSEVDVDLAAAEVAP